MRDKTPITVQQDTFNKEAVATYSCLNNSQLMLRV